MAPIKEHVARAAILVAVGLFSMHAVASGLSSATVRSPAILGQGEFANCPAFAAGASLQVFDQGSWVKHLQIAVAQPNDLKQWSVDFSKEVVIRFTRGSKPSAGYQIEPMPPLQVQRGRLTIPVSLSEPKAGEFVATVMTSPCLYLHVEGSQYSTFAVVDADTGVSLQELER